MGKAGCAVGRQAVASGLCRAVLYKHGISSGNYN